MLALRIGDECELAETSGELKELYELMGCDLVDIVVRNVEGRPYNIVCDDEGLLKDNLISLVSMSGERVVGKHLVGTILVLGVADDGELASLSLRDVIDLCMRTVHADEPDGRRHFVLFAD